MKLEDVLVHLDAVKNGLAEMTDLSCVLSPGHQRQRGMSLNSLRTSGNALQVGMIGRSPSSTFGEEPEESFQTKNPFMSAQISQQRHPIVPPRISLPARTIPPQLRPSFVASSPIDVSHALPGPEKVGCPQRDLEDRLVCFCWCFRIAGSTHPI